MITIESDVLQEMSNEFREEFHPNGYMLLYPDTDVGDYEIIIQDKEGNTFISEGGYYTASTGPQFNYTLNFTPIVDIRDTLAQKIGYRDLEHMKLNLDEVAESTIILFNELCDLKGISKI